MKKEVKKKTPGERRREAIVEAAWYLFKSKGYMAVSVDEIIRKSGGSKATLYALFGSKEGLFLDIVTSVMDEIKKDVEETPPLGQSPRESLTRIGMAVSSRVLTEKGIGLFRLSASISPRFPKLARQFYEAGPGHTMLFMSRYLDKEVEAGRLKIDDTALAADLFLGMILMKGHISLPVGCGRYPTQKEIKRVVDRAVEVFLAAYGK